MKFAFLVTSAALFLPSAHAWGAEGHEIVATIAQAYLQPKTLSSVCELLGETSCHLAPVSNWADKVKRSMPWSSSMHYVNPVDDHPSRSCPFPGPNGWVGPKNANILDAVKNMTSVLQGWVRREKSDKVAEQALKFLVHFVGDMHQPMHLSGRAKGGNDIKVRFNGKSTNLHSVWDSALIDKFMGQTPQNYSKPISNRAVEGALKGKEYDPYIRRIMWEGVLGSWKKEVTTWFICGTGKANQDDPDFGSGENQHILKSGIDINPDGPVVCPYSWAKAIHPVNCDIAWPSEFDDDDNGDPKFELDNEKYAGVIGQRKIVEKLLAQGGIRLAGILNYVFAK